MQMKIKLYVDQLDSHAHCRLFVNGALAGTITVRDYELPALIERMTSIGPPETEGEVYANREIEEKIERLFCGLDLGDFEPIIYNK